MSINPDEIDLGDSDDDEGEESSSKQPNTGIPDRRRYPWLDNSSGDEENLPSPSQTSSAVVMEKTEPDPEGAEDTRDTAVCLDPVPEPDRNPDEISLDDDNDKGAEGVNEGSKVKPSVVIKRRNMSLYQTQQDD